MQDRLVQGKSVRDAVKTQGDAGAPAQVAKPEGLPSNLAEDTGGNIRNILGFVPAQEYHRSGCEGSDKDQRGQAEGVRGAGQAAELVLQRNNKGAGK